MTTGTRIPRNYDDYNAYITTTIAYLTAGVSTTNAARLGILETEVTQWKLFGTRWNALYPKYVDKKNSRTTAIKDEMTLIT